MNLEKVKCRLQSNMYYFHGGGVTMTFALCDDNLDFSSSFAKKINSLLLTMNNSTSSTHSLLPPCVSGNELLDILETQNIDVVFLDIDMPETNGFDIARVINLKYPDTLIVFISSYDDYVFESFNYSPFFFMRKTKVDEELERTLTNVINKWNENHQTITISSFDKDMVVYLKDIEFVESSGNYCLFHMINGEIIKCRSSLKFFDSFLAGRNFVKVHPAFCVNEEHIQCVDYSNLCLIMKSLKKVYISKRRLNDFKNAYFGFTRKGMC